jgi:hypothetical protein
MRTSIKVLVFFVAVAAAAEVVAQTAAPPVPLWPAPMLATGRDGQGRIIPFGVPPYYPPETPLGSGPYKAIMVADPSLPEHILYYPGNLDAAGKLPIISWGNGACIHAGNRFRGFLTEIASHGFLVISAGRMGHVALEVGPQEFTPVRQPWEPAPPAAPPIPDDPTAPWRTMRSTADHLKQAIDWAIAENNRSGSRFYGKLDTTKIGVGGQSCGGGLAMQMAADPRITAVGMFNSGSRLTPQVGSTANPAEVRAQGEARLNAVHSPILFLTGNDKLDGAHFGGRDSFSYLSKVPAIWAWQDGTAHIASYGAPNGGAFGRIASEWYKWQLKGDVQAARMFEGPDCTLCKAPTWYVQKKNIK